MKTASEARGYLRERLNLAEAGQYRCNFCQEVKPLEEGLVVSWGGQVFFALCPACFPERAIAIREGVMRDGGRGVKVGFLNEGDTPLIQLARGGELRKFTASSGLAKKRKFEVPDG